ncbi:MAG: DNA/RNA non-specific endonuclease [Lachnospiraceae bacterium]
MEEIPAFADAPYVVIDDNEPDFQESDYSETSYEYYSDLDELGRCGVAVSNIGKDLMPTKKRGSIGKVKPSGWHTVKYDFVDGKYLYNRCHLIGYQLTAENANEKNLITGTRYMNVDGMLPFENMVADYIKETGNHVLYRVTPIYTGDNLVADGVEMEAEISRRVMATVSRYHVFVYNEQPGVAIDHATGESHLAENAEVYASHGQSRVMNVQKKFRRKHRQNRHRFRNRLQRRASISLIPIP